MSYINSLRPGQAHIIIDYKMKMQPTRNREARSAQHVWFGKTGMNFHGGGAVVITRQTCHRDAADDDADDDDDASSSSIRQVQLVQDDLHRSDRHGRFGTSVRPSVR